MELPVETPPRRATGDASRVQVSSAEPSPAQVSPAEPSPAQVSPADVSFADVLPAEMPAAELTLPDVVRLLRGAGCVFAEDEAGLLLAEARTPAALTAMVRRRVAGEPLEQVLGWAELCGVRVAVEPGVFVPRRRTQLLVAEATALAGSATSRADRPPVVVDLCCGSGAVAAAVAANLPAVELHAADADPAAVRCARRNLAPVGGHVHQGDLDAALPVHLLGRVDVLVANAPYVPTDEIALMPAEARVHEAAAALDGGADGLDVVRRVLSAAPRWLAPGGSVLVETGEHQAARAVAVLRRHGLTPRVASDDTLPATAVVGTMPGPRGRAVAHPARDASAR